VRSLKADQFFKVASLLGRLNEYLRTGAGVTEKVKNKTTLAEKDRKALTSAIKDISDSAEGVSASITIMAVDDLLKRLEGEATYEDLKEGVRDIEITFRREVSTVMMFAVDPRLGKLSGDSSQVFGLDFDSKFPSSLYDLEEACKCIAMGRSTASVFHLMRVMETLLRAVHACLGLPSPTGVDKNWGNMLQAIKTDMTSRNANGNSGWAGDDRRFFEDLYASIDAVRVAWRNTTMHVERRYDQDEAEHLLQVVKALAKKLAGRTDETGTPAA
jgi:hypothetical protein